jgi:hypothetical protein
VLRAARVCERIVEHVAGGEDYQVALATYRAACERWPGTPITLRHGARVIEDSRRPRGCRLWFPLGYFLFHRSVAPFLPMLAVFRSQSLWNIAPSCLIMEHSICYLTKTKRIRMRRYFRHASRDRHAADTQSQLNKS